MRSRLVRSPGRITALAVLVAAGVLLPAASGSIPAEAAPASVAALGDTSDFTIASFDVDYRLGRDADRAATLHVVETIVAVFPDFDQNHGLERALPRSYARADLGLEVLSVTDEHGAPRSFTSYDEDYAESFRVLQIGDADRYVHGRQTYVIEYTMRDVVRNFGDTAVDEFYWDVNGDGWGQPFERVSAVLRLAPELREAATGAAACYVGGYGDDAGCEVRPTDDGFTTTVAGLQPYETVTWAIAFESGTFRAPPLPTDSWIVQLAPWLLLGALAACALVVLWLRVFVFRNAPGRGIVIPQYEGYPELGVMEAADLIGRTPRGLPAQFVQLVVTRAARLIDRGDDAERDTRYRLELLDPAGLDRDDAIAAASIFGTTDPGTEVALNRSDVKLGDRLSALTAKVSTEVSRRYRARRTSPWTRIVRLVLFVNGVAAVLVGFWAENNEAWTPWLFPRLALVVVVGLVAYGFAGAPERLTREGALATEHLRGIRDYLQLAQADRIRVLQSAEGAQRTPIDPTDGAAVVKLDERLLPYAIIWGIEDQWQRELGTLYATTPTELSSTLGTTNFAAFTTGYAAASFATTPPVSTSSSSWSGSGGSSFSGGSGGGGFSGGGGGGGGGGGW